MKKSLSVVLSTALVASMFASVAFADSATTPTASTSSTTTATTTLTTQQKYDALVTAGIFEGDDTGANLSGNMTRAQLAKILVKLKGLTEDAASASVYKDLDGAGWAAGYIGAVTKAGLMDGVWDGQFGPSGNVTKEQLATVLVRALGLSHDSTDGVTGASDWAKGYVAAAIANGLIPNATDFTTNAIRGDLVDATYVVKTEGDIITLTAKTFEAVDATHVKVTFSNGDVQTFEVPALTANTETAVKVTYKGKDFNGKVTLAVTSVDLSSAVAVNSKVVEVALGTAATAVDASMFSVKDAAGNVVAVASAKIAPYSTDNKTALVTLGADTTAGTLYKITSGSKTVNFGGKTADTTAPTVTGVAVNDYNQIEVTFSEPVDISKLAVTASEKYGTQTALNTSNFTYDGSTKVKITTDAQKAATLYGLNISGAADFAGNAMTADTAETFVGIAMNTSAPAFAANGVNALNSKTVTVKFNKKIDSATTLNAANYTIAEAYGNNTAIPVQSVAVDANDASGQTVDLTLGTDLSGSTLYTLSVNNVKTLYGTALTSAITASFVGVAKDTTALSAPTALATNNTTITLTFGTKGQDSVDPAVTADMFAISEAYGSQAALAITGVSVTDNVVTLTTAAQNVALYNVTIKAGIKDVSGNATTANLTTTVVGKAVAAKISSITNASLNPLDATDLQVTFNQNVGATASDVSHYSIDGSVGYPTKAYVDATNKAIVHLVIPTTTSGKIYTLTVNGLENSDNIAMDAAGVTAKFVGSGVVATAPSLVAAMAKDSQTVELYFDQAASNLDGKIFSSTSGTVNAASLLTYVGNGAAADLNGATAVVDPANANALIIRVATGTPFAKANASTSNTFTLTAPAGAFVTGKNTVVFASNDAAAPAVKVTAVTAQNSRTVRVYFDQPVKTPGAFAVINTASGYNATGAITLSNPIAVDGTKAVYDFATSAALANQAYFLNVDPSVTSAALTSIYGGVTAYDTDANTVGIQPQAVQFAGNATAASAITSVPVTMADNKTIVVYFPEAMNVGQVQTPANYSLVDSVGAAVYASATNSLSSQITNIAYDSATNKATITLMNALNASANGYYLVIGAAPGAITNALGTRAVQTADTVPALVKSQFASNTTAAAKLTVTSVTYSAGALTVNFNQAVQGTAFSLSDLNVNVVKDGSTTATGLVAGDVAKITPNLVTDGSQVGSQFKSVTIALNNSVVLNQSYAGTAAFASTSTQVGINGNAVDSTVSTVFAQK